MVFTKYSIILVLVSSFSFLQMDCKDDPPIAPPPSKDMRSLKWTVDTLSYPGSMQTSMRRIWASSANDVYVVGHNERGYGKMYHYNGSMWESVKLSNFEGGNISVPIDLIDIYGFSENNIYAIGEELFWDPEMQKLYDSSLVLHYDGTGWNKMNIENGGRLQAIGGAASDDFWIGDASIGTLYHVINGSPIITNKSDTLWYKCFIGNSPNNIYALAYNVDKYQPLDSTRFYILHYNGSSWELKNYYIETFSNLPWSFGTIDLWMDKNSEVFYSVGYGIYKKYGDEWMKMLESATSFYNIYGTAIDNIFVVGESRKVFHYDGIDWEQLIEPLNFSMIDRYNAVWTDGVEVFIVGSDGSKSYILHGK